MKKAFYLSILILLITFSLMSITALSLNGQPTNSANQTYTLTIDQKKLGKLHDTVIFKKKYFVLYLPVKFSNNSNDTLSYITYSCSWDQLFHTNSNVIKVCYQPCESNYPVVKNLSPHKSISYILPITLETKTINSKFRIGVNLFLNTPENKNLFPLPTDRKDNLIWSNEVYIP